MSKDVNTSFYFLPEDPLWEKEKPYTLKFTPTRDFPVTNKARIPVDDILVKDIRGRESSLTFEHNGFTVLRFKDLDMTYQDWDDENKVKGLYLKQLAEDLKVLLDAKRVQVFDFVIRKTDSAYPVASGTPYTYMQPANIVHIDATPAETRNQLKFLNPEDSEELEKDRYQYVNIWKPLRGPVANWPLAICDFSTIDFSKDIIHHDTVFSESLVESGEVHRAAAHQFYYLSDQDIDEALVFCQADSISGKGVPHASFPNPLASSDSEPRESIEVRTLVYY